VASSPDFQPLHQQLFSSVILDKNNWSADLKYLIPALGQFLIAVIFKHPSVLQEGETLQRIMAIVDELLSQFRMEHVAHDIVLSLFEKGLQDQTYLGQFLYKLFQAMHTYKNATKSKAIPANVMKSIHVVFSTLVLLLGTEAVIQATD